MRPDDVEQSSMDPVEVLTAPSFQPCVLTYKYRSVEKWHCQRSSCEELVEKRHSCVISRKRHAV